MIYTVTTNPTNINFAPATVVEEILQNVYTIVSTVIYSVPLFRSFGVDISFLDEPNLISKARMVAEIIEKVQLFEDRVIVEEIKFVENELDGKLKPILTIRIKEGVVL